MNVDKLPARYRRLVSLASAARKNSHSPYSGLRVGAALLASSGKVYTGCNIENSSFSLTICAERTALFKAVSEAERSFKAIAISSDLSGYTPPCGACRQVMVDLAPAMDVILTSGRGGVKLTTVRKLLPAPFSPSDLPSK